MSKFLSFVRLREWLTSKVTMMIGILLQCMILVDVRIDNSWEIILSFFLYVSSFLAISYVANDYFDMEVDKLAGKKKIIAEMPRMKILMWILGIMIIGNVPIFLVAKHKILFLWLSLFIYIFGILYSAPIVRFKEKGIIGLIECSIAQRCLPLFVICCLINMSIMGIICLSIWIVISFFDGLRYILIHQIVDMDNDIKSGVKTFVTEKRKNYRKYVYALFICEIVMCMISMLLLLKTNIFAIIIGLLINVALEYCIYKVLCIYAQKDWMVSFDSVPLECFLNVIMPITMCMCLLEESMFFIVLAIGLFAICFNMLKVKIGIAKIFVISKIKK